MINTARLYFPKCILQNNNNSCIRKHSSESVRLINENSFKIHLSFTSDFSFSNKKLIETKCARTFGINKIYFATDNTDVYLFIFFF